MHKSIVLAAGIIVLGAVVAGGARVLKHVQAPSQPVERSSYQMEVAAAEKDVQGIGVYRISQEESSVKFELDEVLRGEDVTVVGTSDQIAGDMVFNPQIPSESVLGKIRINARTLKTDNENRDKAINNMILKTDVAANEFIEFTPKLVAGWPGTLERGVPFDIQITGDLFVSGVTREVMFDGVVQLAEANAFVGDIETSIIYKDFGLFIPELPFLANVEDEVVLRAHVFAALVE